MPYYDRPDDAMQLSLTPPGMAIMIQITVTSVRLSLRWTVSMRVVRDRREGGSMSDDAVVIIGAGQAGLQLAASLRSGGHTGPIDLVSAELHLPYQRPPLSKDYLAGAMDVDSLALRGDAFFADKQIRLHRSDVVVAVDRTRALVRLQSGSELRYDHLVFAT